MLKDSLPALLSHCLDKSISVKTAVALGARGLTWPPWLSSAANHELALLESALAMVPLSPGHDLRFITTSPSSSFRTSLVYEAIRATATAPPPLLADVNWRNFAPAKVQFAFWLLRLGRTRTRDRLHRHGCLDTDICPFCPGVEDVVHLFVTCPRLRGLWDRFFPDAIASTDVLSIHSSLASTIGLDELSTNTTLLLTFVVHLESQEPYGLRQHNPWRGRHHRVDACAPPALGLSCSPSGQHVPTLALV